MAQSGEPLGEGSDTSGPSSGGSEHPQLYGRGEDRESCEAGWVEGQPKDQGPSPGYHRHHLSAVDDGDEVSAGAPGRIAKTEFSLEKVLDLLRS